MVDEPAGDRESLSSASQRAAVLRRQETAAGLAPPRRIEAAPADGDIHDVVGFLAGQPPFSDLEPATLRSICAGAEVEYFGAGQEILTQAGEAARFLYVVRVGAVELVDGDEVLDVLEEGESFGHPSLLSGAPPVLTVRAREETLCYVLPAPAALRALTSGAGLKYVAATLRERLAWAEERARGMSGDVRGARVRNLIRSEPLLCPPEATVKEAAARMAEAKRSSLLVPLAGRYGIVTDSDLRARVVAAGAPYDTPLSAVMTDPAETAGPDQSALEVMIEMLDRGIHHVAVVDERGTAIGVVSQEDLLTLEGRSPLAVRNAVVRAGDLEQLAAAAAQLPETVITLLDASVEPLDVTRIIAANSDAIVRRLLAFGQERLGEAPAPWAWIGLGSEARREQTLVTDQDNSLAYAGPREQVDAYFMQLATYVNEGLARCGFAACRAGVMARNPEWRMPIEEWVEIYRAAVREPQHLEISTILIDFRVLAGELDAETPLREVIDAAGADPGYVGRLAREASHFKPPTGFLREFVVDAEGAHQGTLDIKRSGAVPIMDIARALGVAAHSPAVSTPGRLRAAARAGLLDDERRDALLEAFAIVCKVRLEHQVALIQREREPDDHVDPRDLPPLARRQLKEAFKAVTGAQKYMVSRQVATRSAR